MPSYQTSVTQLLRAYHGREAICTEKFDPPGLDQIRYLCSVGLGPIAFHTYGVMLRTTEPATYSVVQSADLTTRVLYKQMQNATVGLLAKLNDVGITPVLLKGISTANEFYSPSHLRLMGDVDILVRPAETELTMSKIAELGYEIADEDWRNYYKKGHHHLPEARNPKSGVTVEVHTGLFVPGGPFAEQPVFQSDNIEAQRIEFNYYGVRAARLTPEFQLVYTISHWGLDGNWAVNLTSINDTIHILRRYESELNWSMLAGWIAANPWIYANIASLLNYLDQADIVAKSPKMREALANSKFELQPRTLKTLMWLLHNYPFNAREKTRDAYALWRAQAIWQDLTKPDSRDIKLPFFFLRTAVRSVHHGKYNPLGWLLSQYRHFTRQSRTE